MRPSQNSSGRTSGLQFFTEAVRQRKKGMFEKFVINLNFVWLSLIILSFMWHSLTNLVSQLWLWSTEATMRS